MPATASSGRTGDLSQVVQEDSVGATTPRWAGNPVLRGSVAGLVAGMAYLGVLIGVAVGQGRSPMYPLRAILAVFRGNRVLPGESIFVDKFGAMNVVRSFGWLVLLSVLGGVVLAVLVRGRLGSRWLLLAAGLTWGLALFAIGILGLDRPGSANLRRSVSSHEGVRELGRAAFLAAHVTYGLVLGALLHQIGRRAHVSPLPGRSSGKDDHDHRKVPGA